MVPGFHYSSSAAQDLIFQLGFTSTLQSRLTYLDLSLSTDPLYRAHGGFQVFTLKARTGYQVLCCAYLLLCSMKIDKLPPEVGNHLPSCLYVLFRDPAVQNTSYVTCRPGYTELLPNAIQRFAWLRVSGGLLRVYHAPFSRSSYGIYISFQDPKRTKWTALHLHSSWFSGPTFWTAGSTEKNRVSMP